MPKALQAQTESTPQPITLVDAAEARNELTSSIKKMSGHEALPSSITRSQLHRTEMERDCNPSDAIKYELDTDKQADHPQT